jgi:hypothetical protein
MEEFVASVEREMGGVHSSVLKKMRIVHSISAVNPRGTAYLNIAPKT